MHGVFRLPCAPTDILWYSNHQSYYILYESASGYALFERTGGEEIGERNISVQTQLQDYKKFSKDVHLRSFLPFTSGENALLNINDVSEGTLDEETELKIANSGS